MPDGQETVKVTFNPAAIGTNTSPVTTDVPPTGLTIPPGTTIIIFNLVTEGDGSGAQATYPQSPSPPPVRFPDRSRLDLPFSDFAWGLTDFQLMDVNEGPSAAGTYTFSVFVEYALPGQPTQTYSGDPLIINEPPAS